MELAETFIRIAEAGGIGAAARTLDTTQPTVTRRLQQFEAMLGAKLVERSPQGMALTPFGALVLPEARELAARWGALSDLARQHIGDGAAFSGRIRVVSSRSVGSAFLPALIADFLDRHPDIRIDLRFDDAGVESGADMAIEGVDFALREGRGGAGPGEASREIGRVDWVLCASPEAAQRLAFERGVDAHGCEPMALSGAGVILACRPRADALRFQGRGGEQMDARFDPIATFDDVEPALDLALGGVGLALLPRWRIAPLLKDGQLVQVAAPWCEGEAAVTIAWSPTRLRSAAATAFQEIVVDALSAALDAPPTPSAQRA